MAKGETGAAGMANMMRGMQMLQNKRERDKDREREDARNKEQIARQEKIDQIAADIARARIAESEARQSEIMQRIEAEKAAYGQGIQEMAAPDLALPVPGAMPEQPAMPAPAQDPERTAKLIQQGGSVIKMAKDLNELGYDPDGIINGFAEQSGLPLKKKPVAPVAAGSPPMPGQSGQPGSKAAAGIAQFQSMPPEQQAAVRQTFKSQPGVMASLGAQVMQDMESAPAAPAAPTGLKPGKVYVNPQTGERVRFNGQGWDPMQ